MLLVAPLLEVSLFASKKAANLVNSLRISHSAQPNSSLVAHPFAVTKLSSRAQLSRIMGARNTSHGLLPFEEGSLGRCGRGDVAALRRATGESSPRALREAEARSVPSKAGEKGVHP